MGSPEFDARTHTAGTLAGGNNIAVLGTDYLYWGTSPSAPNAPRAIRLQNLATTDVYFKLNATSITPGASDDWADGVIPPLTAVWLPGVSTVALYIPAGGTQLEYVATVGTKNFFAVGKF